MLIYTFLSSSPIPHSPLLIHLSSSTIHSFTSKLLSSLQFLTSLLGTCAAHQWQLWRSPIQSFKCGGDIPISPGPFRHSKSSRYLSFLALRQFPFFSQKKIERNMKSLNIVDGEKFEVAYLERWVRWVMVVGERGERIRRGWVCARGIRADGYGNKKEYTKRKRRVRGNGRKMRRKRGVLWLSYGIIRLLELERKIERKEHCKRILEDEPNLHTNSSFILIHNRLGDDLSHVFFLLSDKWRNCCTHSRIRKNPTSIMTSGQLRLQSAHCIENMYWWVVFGSTIRLEFIWISYQFLV